MNPRTKYVIAVLSIWLALFGASFFIAKKLIVTDFEQLEYSDAIEASRRIARTVISDLHYIDVLAADMAYWDDTYNYIQKPNDEYIHSNFSEDFFKDKNINEVIFLSLNGKVVWSQGYNLLTNKFYPVEPSIMNYFKNNSLSLIKYKEKYNNSGGNAVGISGFLQQPSQPYPNYYVVNYTVDSNENNDPNGFIIFGKTLTPEFINKIGHKLDYAISVQAPTILESTPERKQKLAELIDSGRSYVEPINNQRLAVYSVLKDFDFKPIGLLQTDLSRDMHQSIQKAAVRNQTLLFIVSMVGLLLISILIYLLFRKQERITNSFERFVPHEFLELLNKKNILEVTLGDNLKHTIAVLFLDIRNFTTLSESLTPQGNFDFVNSVLKQLSPIIVEHQGFIDKFVGDAIMALFPGETCADDAVNSALAILKKLALLNKTNSWLFSSQEVHVGIGINSGELMLGIVGETNRLESTVIGDVVNTAARIESMTKTYEENILISQSVYQSLKRPDRYEFINIGEVMMKGKVMPVKLYGVHEKESQTDVIK